jgi:hypothetical protein
MLADHGLDKGLEIVFINTVKYKYAHETMPFHRLHRPAPR